MNRIIRLIGGRAGLARLAGGFLAGALVMAMLMGAFPSWGRTVTGSLRTVVYGGPVPAATTVGVVALTAGDAALPAVMTPQTIPDIVAQASPAVVKVQATVVSQVANPFINDPFFREFFGNQSGTGPQTEEQQMLGSGFIIRPDGYILTNDHVIQGAGSVTVTLAGQDKSFPAQVVGSDYSLDLAVLKINDGDNLPVLPLGSSNQARVGDWVIAIGNPYGLDHTVTVGVLSAKGRPITAGNRTYSNLLQTDAAINPGNSGGPLLNLAGQVIGINTAVDAQAQGIGFAIPTSTVLGVLPHLLRHTPTPYLGVMVENVPGTVTAQLGLSPGQGALIAAVEPNSPAAAAGLQKGDVIAAFNGRPVEGPDDLVAKVQACTPGTTAQVQIFRNGRSMTIPVTVGSQ
ncbi:MAG: trypsin-like peptidase domain-containing protein [Peptococcaceae bacterium]|jgi:S1-C subfamily serine protease|nr:trypsin-like peptidase domain-containing protein [Peptococcaceae bacterium]